MAAFTLAVHTLSGPLDYSSFVVVSRFDNKAEVRGLMISGDLSDDTVTVRSPNFTSNTGLQAYTDFYEARKGPYEAFTWTSDFNGTAYNVRFEGNINRQYDPAGFFFATFTFLILSEG